MIYKYVVGMMRKYVGGMIHRELNWWLLELLQHNLFMLDGFQKEKNACANFILTTEACKKKGAIVLLVDWMLVDVKFLTFIVAWNLISNECD